MATYPDNESRMDDELHRQGETQAALERWIDDKYNQELAETLVHAWQELKCSYEAAFGDDAYLPDEMGIDEVQERFGVEVKR